MMPSPPCRVLVDVDDMECSVGLQLSVLDTIFDSHEHLNFAKRFGDHSVCVSLSQSTFKRIVHPKIKIHYHSKPVWFYYL